MTSALERGLFLLAERRLLLLELRDAEEQLRDLAAGASPPERALLDEGLDALAETVAAGRRASGRIEELVPALEAELDERSGHT